MAAPACGRSEGSTAPYLGAALGAGLEPKQLRLGDTHSHEESNIFIKQILMFMSPEHMNDLLMIRTTYVLLQECEAEHMASRRHLG